MSQTYMVFKCSPGLIRGNQWMTDLLQGCEQPSNGGNHCPIACIPPRPRIPFNYSYNHWPTQKGQRGKEESPFLLWNWGKCSSRKMIPSWDKRYIWNTTLIAFYQAAAGSIKIFKTLYSAQEELDNWE